MIHIDKTERTTIDRIIRVLKKAYPEAACSLNFKTPHQLLVATILSAQCTDERVNAVTPALFEKYNSPTAFAQADTKELETDIRTTGFYRNKAKAIRESSRMIIEQYKGRMPRRMEDLVKLPGVGRKTASVILGTAFGKAEGIVVDTHVARLSKRLGFTAENDPVKIENDLIKLMPRKEWIIFSHLMIFHGRSTCKARRPECRRCVVANYCPSAKLFL